MKKYEWISLVLVPVVFVGVYNRVFIADYLYLDEPNQLWYHSDGSTRRMFLSQGRWLTGLLMDAGFGRANSIADLHYLRVASLFGWMSFAFVWVLVFRRWVARLGLDQRLLPLSVIFIAACPSTAISIGWASCLELSIAMLAGLAAGSVLFEHLATLRAEDRVTVRSRIFIGMLIPALICLFLYQNAFGLFLLPFVLNFFFLRDDNSRRILLVAVVISMLIYVIYFGLYKYGLGRSGVLPSDRTGITHTPWSKLLFFFSGPLPMTFNGNYLYETQTLLPQVIAPMMMVIFLLLLGFKWRGPGLKKNLVFVVMVLLLLVLIYLPSMISAENFASYRTLGALGLTVFLMFCGLMFDRVRVARVRTMLAVVLSVFLVSIGYYNYNEQFSRPLEKEFASLKDFTYQNHTATIDTIIFIRADKRSFRKNFGIRSSRDEFGNPSTTRDWVPDALMRQLILEKTGDRVAVARLVIRQFESGGMPTAGDATGPNYTHTIDTSPVHNSSLIIDMDRLLGSHP